MKEHLAALAKDIAAEAALDPEVGATAFDPATLLLIIEIVAALVELLAACNKSAADGVRQARDPGIRQVLAAMRATRDAAPWMRLGRRTALALAVLRGCGRLTPERAEAVFAEALS